MMSGVRRVLRAALLASFLAAAPTGYLHAQDTSTQEETGELTWKWINFAILAAGLGYLMAKMLPPYFRARSIEIQSGIAEAQALKADAEKRVAQMEARLAVLGEEIEKFRVQAHAEMEQEGKRIAEETSRQLRRLQAQTELEMETAAKTVRRELKTFAAKLALDLAEQRIRTRLDAPTEAGLIEDFVQDLEASRN